METNFTEFGIIDILFGNNISAFAIDIGLLGGTLPVEVWVSDRELRDHYYYLTPSALRSFEWQFLGFSSPIDLYSVRFAWNDPGESPSVYFDKLFHESTSAVPEPATILLFAVGLLGIAGVARRYREARCSA